MKASWYQIFKKQNKNMNSCFSASPIKHKTHEKTIFKQTHVSVRGKRCVRLSWTSEKWHEAAQSLRADAWNGSGGGGRHRKGAPCLFKTGARQSALWEKWEESIKTCRKWPDRRSDRRRLVYRQKSVVRGIVGARLGRTTNDQRTNIIKMIQKYSQWYLQYNSIS